MGRDLSIRQLATTEDTGEPVIRAEFEDTGSRLDAILCDDRSLVRVWTVHSNRKGDMKLMLDEICHQLSTSNVHFLEPDLGPLEDRLKNAARHEETVTGPDGNELKSVYLAVEWDYETGA